MAIAAITTDALSHLDAIPVYLVMSRPAGRAVRVVLLVTYGYLGSDVW